MSRTIKGYKSPRTPFLFFRGDWPYGIEIGRQISDFETELESLLPEDVLLEADYRFSGQRVDEFEDGRTRVDYIGMESLEELFDRMGEYDELVTGTAEYEVGGSTGEIRYETSNLEMPGRITAEFEIPEEEDPAVEEAVEKSVHSHFNSFLGWDLPGKHPRQYVEKYI